MKYRVLYVDDDPGNRYLFETACANDFEVRTAESAEEAIDTLRRDEIAVLLTDQRMPGRTGVELAAAAREQFPETIRMLVTAYADMDSAIDAINWGQVHRYLRKPWDIRELRATLKEACDLYWMNREITDLRRRLFETERVYAIGVVATSIGRELTRPIGHLHESLAAARRAVGSAAQHLGSPDTPRQRALAEIEGADAQIASAQVYAEGILDLLRGIDLAVRERKDDEQRTVALEEVIRLTLQVLRGEFRTRAQVRLDVRPVPVVRGSRTSLGQVVLNLLVNALQSFSSAAEPRTVGSPAGADNLVTVRLFSRSGCVCMEVEDNGVPIPQESIGHMFDPLTSHAQSSNRLGLAISKRIVEELAGRLEAEPLAEGGTRLRLVLPPALAE